MKQLTAIGTMFGLILALGTANAATTVNTGSGNDTVRVGYDGTNIRYCLAGALTTMTASSSTLGTDFIFNTEAGTDDIRVLISGETYDCGGTTLNGSFSYGTKYIDINGGNDNDVILGGAGEGQLAGGTSNDGITIRFDYQSADTRPAIAFGNDGDDDLCSNMTGSVVDRLEGGNNADEFKRLGNNTGGHEFVCGAGVDKYENDISATLVDGLCETGEATPTAALCP